MTSREANHYSVLGVATSATPDDIKKAYRKLSLRWHPDKNPSNQRDAQRHFDEISVAYQILISSERRALFNARLTTASSSTSSSAAAAVIQTPVINGGETTSVSELRQPESDFTLRDSRDVFHDFFGGKVPFSEMFGSSSCDVIAGNSVSPPADGGPASGVTMTTTPFSFPCSGDNGDCVTRSEDSVVCGVTTSTVSKPPATIKSVTTSTRLVHGKKLVTKKVVDNGVETVTVEEDGKLVSKTINGTSVDLVHNTTSSTTTDSVTV